MALVVKDRVKETTTTTGTGAVTLGGAATGFKSFSVIGDGNTTHYAIVDSAAGDFEIGLGTYTASGTLLSRDTVFESSNSGSAVSFSAGSKDVFVTYPAGKSVIGGMGYVENAATITQDSTINAGNNAMSAGPIVINSGVAITIPSGSRWTIV